MSLRFACTAVLLLSLPSRSSASADSWYTIAPVALRQRPAEGSVLQRLDANETVIRLGRQGAYLEVRTLAGQRGFVARGRLSKRWIRVLKRERRLELMDGSRVASRYRVALSKFNPLGDKVKRGDGGTPEGRFFISEMTRRPKHARYGARSMRLSYPNVEDARRALAASLIQRGSYMSIVRAIRQGRTPPQRTALGGSIRIHGGGSGSDWTLGCVALEDSAVIGLFAGAHLGMRVDVYASAAQQRQLDHHRHLAERVLAGAKRQLKDPAKYTNGALKVIRIGYPSGDIQREWAVCTDIIVRALRHAGLDLQALVHEDARLHPRRYRDQIRRPNPHIDHRRSRTLEVFFDAHARRLPNKRDFRPGDIVLFDTGIDNGTVFDHIGIVDDKKDAQGLPRIINIWTVGHRTASMDLLGNSYPTVVGHFRLTHPFDYQ